MKRILVCVLIIIIFANLNNGFGQVANFSLVPAVKNFKGYKVDSNARSLGTNYWENNPVLPDLMVDLFQKNLNPLQNNIYAYASFSTALALGDFNNDGYIDVFNGGAAYNGISAHLAFLIWNPSTQKYDEKNLLNDSTNFIGGPTKIVPVYLNNDNYVDLVVFGHVDEGNPNSPNEPISLIISDGKGGYDLTKLSYLIPSNLLHFTIEGGDVGDLNGDGLPDLFITCNSHSYIFLGIPSYPYFSNQMFAHFASDTINFSSNNGFGEVVPDGAGAVYQAVIKDVNGDGRNDVILAAGEQANPNIQSRVLINQGQGKFNESGIVKLPFYDTSLLSKGVLNQDYFVDDLNGDGLSDIISVNTVGYKTWNIFTYIAQRDGSFKIDTSWIKYTLNSTDRVNWKYRLVYYDFNGDGKKDISFLDAGCMAYYVPNNDYKKKTVFIRSGNQFVENSFYNYDTYAQYLFKVFFVCAEDNIVPPIFNNQSLPSWNSYSFCSGDSLKLSITNVNAGDSLKWYYGTTIDSSNISSKIFKDSTKLWVTRTDSNGCVISSDTIQLKKYSIPSKPSISWNGSQFSTTAAGVNYQWLLANNPVSGANNSNYKPIVIGNYRVQVIDSNGCKNVSDSFTLVVTAVNTPTSTPNNHIAKLFPNPATSEFIVQFSQIPLTTITIKLVNANGQIVKEINTNNQSTTIPLSNISTGNYFLKIIGKDYDQTQQLIIKNR